MHIIYLPRLVKLKQEFYTNAHNYNKQKLTKVKYLFYYCFTVQIILGLISFAFCCVWIVFINDVLSPFFDSAVYCMRSYKFLAAGFWLIVPTIVIAVPLLVKTLLLETTDFILASFCNKLIYGVPNYSICKTVDPVYFNFLSQHPDWD